MSTNKPVVIAVKYATAYTVSTSIISAFYLY